MENPEHIFAVRLFLAATAIAVAGVGVNQADWKHPLFVRSFFGSAAILFIAAIFWPSIAPDVPDGIGAILGAVSSNLISWLLLLAITVVAFCFLDYRERANWRQEFPRVIDLLEQGAPRPAPSPIIEKSQSDNRQWLSSYKIFDLADPALLQKAVHLQSQLQSLEKEISTNDAEQLSLKPKDAMAALEAMNNPIPALEILKKNASDLYNRNRIAAANHRAAFGEVLEDIYEQLAAGKLIAKGFLVPVETDSSEIEIPAAHWRLIRFHAAGYTQAEGQGIKYVGVTVARAR